MTLDNSNKSAAPVTRCCICGALAVLLIAPAFGAALAQTGEPPSAAAPATPGGPQQPAPQNTTTPPSPLALPPQSSGPTATSTSTPAEKPGFFDGFARWWRDSVADFNAKLKEQQSKIDDFNKKSAEAAKGAATATQEAMKNAADAVVKSATTKIIEIHEPCTIAGNGAADCASAAVNACKTKGYNDGQPLDVRTAEKCNASLWLQGQQRQAAADCPVETVVLRAACQ